MNKNTDTIHALRDAAREIRRLRNQIVEVKAEAYDVHSEVIKRLFGGSQVMGICSAHQAEKLAEELEREHAEPDPANGSNDGTQRPGDAEATNATRATPPGSLK
jgi:hypothetical protein